MAVAPLSRALLSLIAVAVLIQATGFAQSGTASYPTDRVMTLREQAPLVRNWIDQRLETVLPEVMRREGLDMWIIYNKGNLPAFSGSELLAVVRQHANVVAGTRFRR